MINHEFVCNSHSIDPIDCLRSPIKCERIHHACWKYARIKRLRDAAAFTIRSFWRPSIAQRSSVYAKTVKIAVGNDLLCLSRAFAVTYTAHTHTISARRRGIWSDCRLALWPARHFAERWTPKRKQKTKNMKNVQSPSLSRRCSWYLQAKTKQKLLLAFVFPFHSEAISKWILFFCCCLDCLCSHNGLNHISSSYCWLFFPLLFS